VGEIGLIEELYVVPERRGLGIGRMLLNRALEIGARSQFRHLFIAANPRFDAAGMLTQAGFASIAPFIIYKA
jgi:GNAT superfamily N-acetyltransferase